MRIGVNARVLAYESGGAKEYLISLMHALLTLDKENEYVLFHTGREFTGLFPGARDVVLGTDNRLYFDWVKLPQALERQDIGLAFFPFSNMCPRARRPAVTTMLDLGYFEPSYRMYRLPDTAYMRWAIPYAARKSARLIAISSATKADLVRYTDASADKISVIPLAPDPMYLDAPHPAAVAAVRTRLGLSRDYLLYTGNISPRKNLKRLLQAYAASGLASGVDLAVTGGTAWGQGFDAWVGGLGLAGSVKKLGFVARGDMPALYAGAAAFVFPSLFEGFGLPVVEAQAMGAPVVCSNLTSLPEAAGDGALFVDPMSVASIRDALVQIVTDQDLRSRLIRLGRENAARFSWEKTARATLEVFRQAAGS